MDINNLVFFSICHTFDSFEIASNKRQNFEHFSKLVQFQTAHFLGSLFKINCYIHPRESNDTILEKVKLHIFEKVNVTVLLIETTQF